MRLASGICRRDVTVVLKAALEGNPKDEKTWHEKVTQPAVKLDSKMALLRCDFHCVSRILLEYFAYIHGTS